MSSSRVKLLLGFILLFLPSGNLAKRWFSLENLSAFIIPQCHLCPYKIVYVCVTQMEIILCKARLLLPVEYLRSCIMGESCCVLTQ